MYKKKVLFKKINNETHLNYAFVSLISGNNIVVLKKTVFISVEKEYSGFTIKIEGDKFIY